MTFTYALMLLFVFWALWKAASLYDRAFDAHKIGLSWWSLIWAVGWRVAFAGLGTFFFYNVW